jgi:hypothetical protein
MLEGTRLLYSDISMLLSVMMRRTDHEGRTYNRKEVSATNIQVFFLIGLRRTRFKIMAGVTWKNLFVCP